MCFVYMYICAPYMYSAHGGQKKAFDPLGTEVTDGCKLSCGHLARTTILLAAESCL